MNQNGGKDQDEGEEKTLCIHENEEDSNNTWTKQAARNRDIDEGGEMVELD